jgi:hypothetical protein
MMHISDIYLYVSTDILVNELPDTLCSSQLARGTWTSRVLATGFVNLRCLLICNLLHEKKKPGGFGEISI